MKKLLFLAFFAFTLCVRANEYTLKYSDLPDLITALGNLDGYEHSVDQGPGNPAKVVREPYKFSSDTRARLGADRAALIKEWTAFTDRLADIRLKISGDREKIDTANPKQLAAWKAATADITTLSIELSPITSAELTVNDNPVPISTLSVLNLLRPVTEKK